VDTILNLIESEDRLDQREVTLFEGRLVKRGSA
jgi:hypothetical protein